MSDQLIRITLHTIIINLQNSYSKSHTLYDNLVPTERYLSLSSVSEDEKAYGSDKKLRRKKLSGFV